MAGPFQQKIMRNSQGKLVEAAVEQRPQTINQLASQAGMQAPPTTPMGGGLIGASPDQQKMMGTPNQKANAIRQSQDAITTLAEAKSDSRYRTEKTASESATAAQAGTLQEKLSGSGDRVKQLVVAQMNNINPTPAGEGTPAVAGTASTSTLTTTPEQAGASIIDEINTLLRSGSLPTDEAVQKKLNDLAAATGQNMKELSAAVQRGALTQFKDETGKLVAKAVTDTIGVEQLLTEMNTNKTEMASLLGVTEADITAMSLSDLSDRLDAIQAGTGVQATEQAKSSRLLGSAERAAMTEVGREQSTTGMATVDADLARLSSEMDSAQVIQFGGRDWNIRDLLNDEKLSQLITDYITAPDSDSAKALKSDPQAAGLIAFIERNKKALTDAAAGFGAAATENTAIQADNAKLAQYGGTAVSDQLMKNLVTGWGTPQAARYEKPALLNQIGSLAPEEQAAAVNGMNDLYLAYPDQLNDLKSLTAADLKALSAMGPDKQTGWMRLRNNLDIEKQLSSTNNIDDLVKALFDGGTSLADINTSLANSDASEMMGFGESPMSWMDSNNDNRIDAADLEHMRTKSKERVAGANSLSEIAAGNTISGAHSGQFQSPVTPQARELYDSLTKWIGRDTFTAQESIEQFDSYLNHLYKNRILSDADIPRLEAIVAHANPPGSAGKHSTDPGNEAMNWSRIQADAKKQLEWIRDPSSTPWEQQAVVDRDKRIREEERIQEGVQDTKNKKLADMILTSGASDAFQKTEKVQKEQGIDTKYKASELLSKTLPPKSAVKKTAKAIGKVFK